MWKAWRCSSADVRGLAILLLWAATGSAAAVVASGRNWEISIDSIDCEPIQSQLTLGARIRYLGPKGAVEAPLSYLSDSHGRQFPPQALAWKRGSRLAAEWLSAGGVINVQTTDIGEVRMRFDARDAAGDLHFEFGDVRAFAVRRGAAPCKGVLKPQQIQAPRAARGRAPSNLRVYRGAYPCSPSRTVEAEQPPYAPLQMLVLGRGFLPSARYVQLPAGRVPAQPLAYSGADELKPIEDMARRAIGEDFPAYAAPRHFAVNWGVQRAASGNQIDSIGIYELKACPK